jgi:hypothetical protein
MTYFRRWSLFLSLLLMLSLSGVQADAQDSASSAATSESQMSIPGPLHSFLRMAGISQKVSPDEVLPFLARNVAVRGYIQERPDKPGKQTEFLILVKRYLQQARELQVLAGSEGTIRVAGCADADRLLQILGYRLGQPCGPKALLETADADRAFLTIDSGFPLVDLEEALRNGTPFSYPYASSPVPVLFNARDWQTASERGPARPDVVESLLSDPALARLYWALSRTDAATAKQIYDSLGLKTLLLSSSVLDFYGSHIYIRSGRVVVPGGAPAERAWASLVGAKPENPGEFVGHLITKDQGWLAAYFDALASGSREQQAYFTQAQRLEHCYEALRQPGLTPGAARPAFRPAASIVLLVTRLSLDPAGRPHVPGNLDVWKEILHGKSDSKIMHDWGKRAAGWDKPEQLLEGMFALTREYDRYGPVNLYLQLNEIDRGRSPASRLGPATVSLLAAQFARFGDQYRIFSEFSALNDASIARFLAVAQTLDRISSHPLRSNAVGIFQSNVSLWEILARQGQLPTGDLNESWQSVIAPFSDVRSSAQLFDAGHASFTSLVRSATGKAVFNQDDIVALLAGPAPRTPEEQRVHALLENRIRLVLDDQRLVTIDTLFALGDGLNGMTQGKPGSNSDMLLQLVGEIREFEMPRAIFTATEKAEWSSGQIDNAHIALQARTDLMKVIETSSSPGALAEARGELSPFLRDTLVGLNYAYFEPPGDQVLHNNPLFVRSHDFSGDLTLGGGQSWETPALFGVGEPAGGGGHLAGSLADLPYVLARSDQDFVVPSNVQALIWDEMVPSLLLSASLPRWWGISASELHAAALYQRTGEEILSTAATDGIVRQRALDILSDRIPPQRLGYIETSLLAGRSADALAAVTPADTFFLVAEFRRRFPDAVPAAKELQTLAACCAADVNSDRLARDFGAPHPVLAYSYSTELLNVKTFFSYMNFPSRLLAESWESNNLYWARLLDEKGLPPVMLNELAPQLTLLMTQRIFATDVEDWAAVLRAMRETGEDFRQGRLPSPASAGARDVPPNGEN